MILSPKAGGVRITSTAANHVIHLSRWWNPSVEDQATDRVFRIGQMRDVHVYLPQAVHPNPAIGPMSFDLKLDALMRRKPDLSRGLLLPGEDEGDTSSLFDKVLGAGVQTGETQAVPPAISDVSTPEPVIAALPEPEVAKLPRQHYPHVPLNGHKRRCRTGQREWPSCLELNTISVPLRSR